MDPQNIFMFFYGGEMERPGRWEGKEERPHNRETDWKVQEHMVTSMLPLPLVSAQCPEHWMEGCRDQWKLGIIRNGLQTDLRLSLKQVDRMTAQARCAPPVTNPSS